MSFKLYQKTILIIFILSIFQSLKANKTNAPIAAVSSTVVTNSNDSGAGSLREAIACAVSGDIITFDASTDGNPIQLTSGELFIDKDLTISGNGNNNTILDGASDALSRLVRVSGSASVHLEDLTLTNGGSASFSNPGAGIDISTSQTTTIKNCRFENNITTYIGGAMNISSGNLHVVNSEFVGNSADDGSVLWNQLSTSFSAKLDQCIFRSNNSNLSTIVIFNNLDLNLCTSYGNTNTEVIWIQGAGVANINNNIIDDSTNPLINISTGTVSINNNITTINGGIPIGTNGNLLGNPLFVDAPANDFKLMHGSPCISAGSISFIPADALDIDNDGNVSEQLPLDYDGNSRIFGCGLVDMGAFEYSNNDIELYVTNSNDSGPGSLRELISCAPSGATIRFDVATDGVPIQLTSGQINISNDLNIIGNSRFVTIIDGSSDPNNRLFENSGHDLRLENLGLEGGGSTSFNDSGACLRLSGEQSTLIINCTLADNININIGASIMLFGGDLHIVNSEFSNNSANDGSILWSQTNGNVTLDQCIFFQNNDISFGIACLSGTLNINQSTFYNNTNSRVVQNQSTTNLNNNIFFNNGFAVLNTGSNTTLTAFNNLADMPGSITPNTNGNITGDPLFTDPANLNFTLQPGSPAISKGDNMLIPIDINDVDNDGDINETLSFDFIDNPRIFGCGLVDMGAFEYSNNDIELYVTNSNDSGPGSLRELISCAPSGATIRFDVATDGVPIQLTSGQISITKDLTIFGNGITNTIIDGSMNNNQRIFSVSGHDANFESITIQNAGSPTSTDRGMGINFIGSQASTIENCKLSGHQNMVGGTAIMIFGGELHIVNSEFSNNSSPGSVGVAIWNQTSTGPIQIEQCLFNSNTGTDITTGLNISLTNCTIYDTESSPFIQSGVDLTLNNNIFQTTGNALLVFGSPIVTANNNIASSPGSIPIGVDGNIMGNAQFVDAANGNFNLMSSSPAISKGNNNLVPVDALDIDNDGDVSEQLPLDYDGNSRIFGCGLVDMGAFEYSNNDIQLEVTNSDDSGPGSLRDILACAPMGSTITFNPSTDGNPIQLLSGNIVPGNDDITVIGNGVSNTIIDCINTDDNLFDISALTFTINEVHITNATSNFTPGMIADISSSGIFEIKNSEISNSGSGTFPSLILASGATFKIENTHIHDNFGRVLIIAENSSPNNYIKQCLFNDNSLTQFELIGNKDSGTTTDIYQCTFYNNTFTPSNDPVIKAESDAMINVHNNIFYNNPNSIGAVQNQSNINLIASASANIADMPLDLPIGTFISEDPLFVDAATNDFHLQACSPAISRANIAWAPSEDVDGIIRPLGFGADIGYYEFDGLTSCGEGICGTPIVLDCGIPYQGSNFNGNNNLENYSCTSSDLAGPDKVHIITTTQQGDLEVVLSDLTENLDLLLLDVCGDVLTCSEFGNNSIYISNIPAGDYYLIVDSGPDGTGNYILGDYTITANGNCQSTTPCVESNIVINDPADPAGLFHAIHTLTSNTTINNSGVTFKAGTEIFLENGFTVPDGIIFEALTEDCP